MKVGCSYFSSVMPVSFILEALSLHSYLFSVPTSADQVSQQPELKQHTKGMILGSAHAARLEVWSLI